MNIGAVEAEFLRRMLGLEDLPRAMRPWKNACDASPGSHAATVLEDLQRSGLVELRRPGVPFQYKATQAGIELAMQTLYEVLAEEDDDEGDPVVQRMRG